MEGDLLRGPPRQERGEGTDPDVAGSLYHPDEDMRLSGMVLPSRNRDHDPSVSAMREALIQAGLSISETSFHDEVIFSPEQRPCL